MNDASIQVLVTGINGFVGQHVGQILLEQQVNVVGVGRRATSSFSYPSLSYSSCDLRDRESVEHLVRQHDVDYVIHLAAENNANHSWLTPYSSLQTNTIGSLNLLEALRVRQSKRLQGVLIVGSSHEYGASPLMAEQVPVTEKFPVEPLNPYGWSKFLQNSLAQMYGQLYSIPVVIARTFNLVGPGLREGVCAEMVRKVVEMERGLRSPRLFLDYPEVRRDFLDVRDAAAAYWLLLHADPFPANEVYNVCANQVYSIGEIAEKIRELSTCNFSIESSRGLVHQKGPTTQCGDHSKLRAMTGWKPVYSIDQSLHDMLEAYRQSEKHTKGGPSF